MKSIHRYALHGDITQLKHELDFGAFIHEPESKFQMTLLHLANMKRQVAAVRLLLEYDADIYAIDCDGRTPLDIATSYFRDAENPEQIKNSLEIIDLMLFKEAELRLQGKYTDKLLLKNIKNKFNLTPGDHLKKRFIELTKKAEDKIARGKQIEAASSATKIVSGLRNRKHDDGSLVKLGCSTPENLQNKNPNTPIPSQSSRWLPNIFQPLFGAQPTPRGQEPASSYSFDPSTFIS